MGRFSCGGTGGVLQWSHYENGAEGVMDRKRLEEQMSALPIVQYEFFNTDELVFTDRVRQIGRASCRERV